MHRFQLAKLDFEASIMKLLFLNIYPEATIARFMLSSYLLKAYLEKAFVNSDELEINVINYSNKANFEEITKAIISFMPDWVGYSCYEWNIELIRRVINELHNEQKSYVHIIGGPEISVTNVEKLLRQKVGDYAVIGEGEEKITRLVQHLLEKKAEPPSGVATIINDEFKYAPDYSFIDLSKCPSPYLTGAMDTKLYRRQQVFLETARGCRHRCRYCMYHKDNPSMRYFPLERVLAEIEFLIIKNNVSALRFLDSVFTHDLGRAKKIARYLVELKARRSSSMPWIYWEFIYSRMDDEFIELVAALKNKNTIQNHKDTHPLNRSQVYSDMVRDYTAINAIGLQSFNKESLKAVARHPVKKIEFSEFIAKSKRCNIVFKLDMILGLPFETTGSYIDGLEFIVPLLEDTDHILCLSRLQILPGSDLEEMCHDFKILYSEVAPHVVTATNTLTSAELEYMSMLSAILFRIINSPLRVDFFSIFHKKKMTVREILDGLLNKIKSNSRFSNSRFNSSGAVDDEYWNEEIFVDLSWEWCREELLTL